MNIKYIFTLIASLLPVSQSIIKTVSTDNMSDTCDILDQDKNDCGYVGITQTECEQKSCCWEESITENIPWCFDRANTCYNSQEQMIEPFNSNEMELINEYFDSNININSRGGVAASPDPNTPGGSYYYHWVRDGALSMRSILESRDFVDYESTLKSYTQWVLNTHDVVPYNKIDTRIEPKFELPYGEVYTGGWCRPQNDGPGLQATSLIIFANSLIVNNQSEWVRKYLWTGDVNNYHGGAIKYDLDWIVNGFNTDTCDLWEEITDPDFFWNRITMKKALILGYRFAMGMNDLESANNYYKTMKEINETLYGTHWNENFIQESNSRTRDGAVIVGLNVGWDELDNMFEPSSFQVASTIKYYNDLFCSEYPINHADTMAGVPGIMYGRYKGDVYAGGNPWILTSGALASLFYRGGNSILNNGLPNNKSLAMWSQAFNTKILPSNPIELSKFFVAQADGVLLRLRAHTEANKFRMYEQIDKYTGQQISAKDLTWSYAEIINAMNNRKLYVNHLNKIV
jgi:glucoamylase